MDKAVEMGEIIATRGPWAVSRATEMVNLAFVWRHGAPAGADA
jgi:hypothetical protein